MTSAIDRLEKRGLVRRKTCDSDRRIRFVELTDCGKAFIEEIYARHEKDLEAVTGELGDEERRVIEPAHLFFFFGSASISALIPSAWSKGR